MKHYVIAGLTRNPLPIAVHLIILGCICTLNVHGKNIYLSAAGNDTQTGLSENAPVATVNKAFGLLDDGDTIKVAGFIDISKEVSNANGVTFPIKKFTLDGVDKTISGFTGNNQTRIFQINANEKGCVLKNLTFQQAGAASSSKGAAIYLTASDTRFENCDFLNNTVATNSSGTICLENAKSVVMQSCIIKGNIAKTGGGIYITDGLATIRNCLIAQNTAATGGGITVSNLTAGTQLEISVINSTLYANSSTGYGGAVYIRGQAGSAFKLINVTIAENISQAANSGYGPGLSIRDSKGLKRYIYNCIIEDNIAGDNNTGDISSNYAFNDGEQDFFLYNSCIGSFRGTAYTANLPEHNNTINYQKGKAAGLAQPASGYIASQNSIPLEFDSESLEKGNAQYLKELEINTDQLGNIRAFKNNKCAAGAVEIPAPPVIVSDPHDYQHFIIYGQSLSIGHQSYISLSTENYAGNYMIGDQVWMNGGNATFNKFTPLVSSTIISGTGIAECPIVGAVNHIRLKQESVSPDIDNRFIATSTGTGGKIIAQLVKNAPDNLYTHFLTALKSAYSIAIRSASTIQCPFIFYGQGESDYLQSPATSKEEYKTALLQLKTDMQNDVTGKYQQAENPLFFLYQAGVQYTRTKELGVGMAQLEASNEQDDMVCIGPVYPMTDVGGHLDANGYRWYGEMIGKVHYKTKILGESFKPLQPKELSRDLSDTKKVIIKFLVPEPPLTLDTCTLSKVTNYGFEVFNNDVKQTITSVSVQNDRVILTCAAELFGKIEIVYAGVNVATRGHGNLRDNDAYPAFFNYENQDKKDGNGDFIYPHGDMASLLPISGEPKDESGNIIYGKPYPLYNFCVAFYYAIPEGQQSYVVPNLQENNSSGLPQMKKREDDIAIVLSGKSLQISLLQSDSVQVTVYDISGKTVCSFPKEVLPSRTKKNYSLQRLTQGNYIVSVWKGNKIKTQKIQLIINN